MSAYDQLTQGNETAAQGKYDFWANMFSHFNPPAPQNQPINSSPSFQAATQQAQAATPQTNQSGNFHSATNAQRMGLANDELANSFNYKQQQNASEYNPGEAMKYGLAGLGRMDTMGNLTNKMGQMKEDRLADIYALQDTQNAGKNAQQLSNDELKTLLESVGSLGGTMAGSMENNDNLYGSSIGGNVGGSMDLSGLMK